MNSILDIFDNMVLFWFFLSVREREGLRYELKFLFIRFVFVYVCIVR